MLQGPVPVVVVEVAEEVPAPVDLSPQLTVEGHAHVVLGADPLGQLKLKENHTLKVGLQISIMDFPIGYYR